MKLEERKEVKPFVVYTFGSESILKFIFEFDDNSLDHFSCMYGYGDFSLEKDGFVFEDFDSLSSMICEGIIKKEHFDNFRRATKEETELYVNNHPVYKKFNEMPESHKVDFTNINNRKMFNWFIKKSKENNE